MTSTRLSRAGQPFVRTFGSPYLRDAARARVDELRRKDLALLVWLVLEPRRAHARARLASLLWGDSPEEKARHSLTQALRRVRQALGEAALDQRTDDVALRADVGCDALWLEDALRRGDAEVPWDLFREPFLAGFAAGPGARDFEEWADRKREEYRGLVVRALNREGAAAEAGGRWGEALDLGLRVTELEPLFEEGQRRVMRAWSALGDGSLALRHYTRFAEWLEEEIGSSPDAATRTLEREIRAGEFQATGAAETNRASAGHFERPEREAEPFSDASPAATSRWSGRAWARQRLRAGLVVAIVAVLGVAAGFYVHARGERGAERWPWYASAYAGEQRVVFVAERAGRPELWDMRPSGSDPRRLAVPFDSALVAAQPSPDGSRYAVEAKEGAGRVVLVVSRAGDTVNISRAPGREELGDWAPDGSRLLFTSWRNGHAEMMQAAPDGSRLRSMTAGAWNDDRPCWSPDGGAIAFRSSREGPRTLWLMDADGSRPRRLASLLPEGCRFSPDGKLVAFTARTDAGPRVFVVGRDGSGLRPLADGRLAGWSPTGEWLLYGAMAGGEPQVFRVRRDGAFPANISRDTARAWPLAWLPARPGRVARIRIAAAGVPALGTGEARALRAQALDPAGRVQEGVELRWESTAPAVASVDGAGTVRALSPGQVDIVASLGGWRADTLRLVVAPPAPRLLLHEDFERGIDARVWEMFGTPPPYVAAAVGVRGSHGFVNGGDELYESGVASRLAFPTTAGLTVEFSGRAPLSAGRTQLLAVGLVNPVLDGRAHATAADIAEGGTRPGLEFFVAQGEDGRPEAVLGARRLPFPGSPADWHRYRLQLRPDGWQELFVDERPVATAPPPYGAPPPSLRLVLGYRSYQAQLVHDDVDVYQGLRAASP